MIQIDLFELRPQLLQLSFGKGLHEIIFVEVYDLAIGSATDPAPTLDPQQELLVAEQSTRVDLSQPVLKSPGRLHDLPWLVADGVLAEIINLNNSLHYHSSLLKYVEDFGILSNIENDIVGLVLHLIQFLVKIDQLNEAPFLEEWYFLKELLSF